MSSSSKTSLGLNMWVGSDKPKREDFCRDNEITDKTITALQNTKADKTAVDASLSNKVSRAGNSVPLGTNVLTLAPGRYSVEGATTPTQVAEMNLPSQAWHYEIDMLSATNKIGVAENYKVILAYPNGTNAIFTRRMDYMGYWTGWEQLATATPPQEFDLPVVGGHLFYSKNQLEFVTIDIQINSATIIQPGQIGIVPIGYAPKRNIKFAV
ncbi:MAG: hypothetical protein RRY14_00660, partial [Hydrogenoanaerobacterium sp.]